MTPEEAACLQALDEAAAAGDEDALTALAVVRCARDVRIEWPPGARVRVDPWNAERGSVDLIVEAPFEHRDTAEPSWISQRAAVPLAEVRLFRGPAAAAVLARIREMLWRVVRHEADERFYYKGARIFDPHAREEGRRPPGQDELS